MFSSLFVDSLILDSLIDSLNCAIVGFSDFNRLLGSVGKLSPPRGTSGSLGITDMFTCVSSIPSRNVRTFLSLASTYLNNVVLVQKMLEYEDLSAGKIQSPVSFNASQI